MKKTRTQDSKPIKKADAAGLEAENSALRSRLEEMEATLQAIREGSIDAIVVGDPGGEKVYTLSGAEHPYRVMVETMGEGAVSVAQDGAILYSNKSFSELVRVPLERIIGSHILQYFDSRERSIIFEVLKQAGNSRLEISLSSRGKKIPVYLSVTRISDEGAPDFFSIVVTDLTHQKNEELMQRHAESLRKEIAEREKTERELRQSRQRYRSLVLDQKELVCRFLPDGTLTFVNPAFCALVGMEKDEILGTSFFRFLADSGAARVSGIINQITPAAPDRSMELEVQVKGEVYSMSWNGRALFDSEKNLVEYQAVGRDITARKRAEEELKKRTTALEAVNAELESFSYSVSHDLRAPLRAIDGFVSMLLAETKGKLDPESVRKFNVIKSNAEKMNRLIEDLLRLSRAGRAELFQSRIDMDSLVKDIWKELKAANPGRRMELKTVSLPAALGDSALVRQALCNLLGNAVKFSADRERAVIEVSGSEKDGLATYCVRDNGAGFDMRYSSKLFGVFQRLHSEKEFKGTGVGLAIVKRIIGKHGGEVWAESTLGEGAAFYFTLPAA